MMIKDIKEEGKISLLCLITKCEKGKTQKETPYLSLNLEDASGLLDAKFWNLTEEQVGKYKVGMVVEATGDVIIHRGAIQLRVRSLTPKPEEDMSQFVRQAPMNRMELEQSISNLIEQMKDGVVKDVLVAVLEKNKHDYYSYPAATKNHHAFPGGLAYHSLCMAKMAICVSEQYPFLDIDLLIAGILLHDVGKIKEFTQPVLPEYSIEGNLLGHITIVACMIDEASKELGVQDDEDVLLMKHMVLSHHGKMEYGSPVLPMIPEAEVLSLLDNLDSRMFMMKESLDATQPGKFGPRVFALENRMLYKRKKGNE
ncbi:MAG: HD domain-containing protein [Bacillota bacterium]|nr:HD domain-containing protein [Bacillota bacterium]